MPCGGEEEDLADLYFFRPDFVNNSKEDELTVQLFYYPTITDQSTAKRRDMTMPWWDELKDVIGQKGTS